MPFSGRPLRTTDLILSPPTSDVTSLERVRSGPLSPPPASRPWQNEQSSRNSDAPLSTSAGGYVFSATARFDLPPFLSSAEGAGACPARVAKQKSKQDAASNPRNPQGKKFISDSIARNLVFIVPRLGPRMRCRAAFRHAQHPLDRLKIHFADVRIAPGFFGMAKRRIKDTPFTVHLVPGHGEIMIRSMHSRIIRIVEFHRVETQQHIDLIARPILRLIDFVVLNKCTGKMTSRREARIFIHDRRIKC